MAATKTPTKTPRVKANASPLSKFFQSYQKDAEKTVNDPKRLATVIQAVRTKMKQHQKNPGALKPVWHDLETMVSLAESHAKGTSTGASGNGLVLSTAAMLYLTQPGDFVPDWIPEVGLNDDAAVIGMIGQTIRDDLEKHRKNSSK
jgi:uncharacterized membrane protein YkvA (DUF1232 family)